MSIGNKSGSLSEEFKKYKEQEQNSEVA